MAATTPPAASDEKMWHSASCHCGQVAFRALLPKLTNPTSHKTVKCACSICSKNGYLLAYPSQKEVEWIQGFDQIKRYQFATKTRDHMFCGVCGSSLGIDFWQRGDYGLNVRMFKEVAVDELNLRHFDGKNKVSTEFNESYW